MSQNSNTFKISLKTTSNDVIEFDATPQTTVLQLKTAITQKNEHPQQRIKLVYKGKIIQDNQTMSSLQIREPVTIMVVLRKTEKKDPQTQGINPNLSNIQTGLGDFNPVGFGNFGIMNQPGYMSALSSVASPEKMEQMLDDPFYQKMIEQMMSDPDIMIKAMESSPQLKQMVDSNPMMKMMMSNPELMKAVMTPENMKMAMEMKKNGTAPGMGGQGMNMGGGMGGLGNFGGMGGMGGFGGLGGFGGMGGMNGMGGMGGMNPFMNMGGFNNPFLSGIFPQNNNPAPSNNNIQPNTSQNKTQSTSNNNTSTQPNQQSNPQPNVQPNQFNNPFMNPYMMNPMFSSMFNNPMSNPYAFNNNQVPQQNLEQKYKNQLSTLQSMGFTDKVKNIEALQICLGNVEAAVERLLK